MMDQKPWAIVLTHRKGSALVAACPELFFSSRGFGASESLPHSAPRLGTIPTARDAAALEPLLAAAEAWGFVHPDFAGERLTPSPKGFLLIGLAALLKLGPALEKPAACRGLAVWLSDEPTAETLREHFVKVLEAAGTSAPALAAIGYAAGPEGSFTGLRLGASFASGLALGRHQVELVPLLTSVPQFSESVPEPALRDAVRSFEHEEILTAVARFLWQDRAREPLEGVLYRSEPGPVLVLKGQAR